nr:MAG TPA: hypothetical protein [Caudoviricetes sp.]
MASTSLFTSWIMQSSRTCSTGSAWMVVALNKASSNKVIRISISIK